MHIQPRKLSKGIFFYLRYWEKGKNNCMPARVIMSDPCFKGEYPFPTRELAEEFIKNCNSLDDYKRHANGLKNLKDKKAFGNFKKMREIYFEELKENCKRSYNASELYFDNYVLPYFLDVAKEYNINRWHLHFKNFRRWLVSSAYKSSVSVNKRKEKDIISYSTKNHCIRTLNTFLSCMREENKLLPECEIRCKSFTKDKVDQNARGVDDIVLPIEYARIRKRIKTLITATEFPDKQNAYQAVYDFFTILYNSGLRFNELFSLSYDDIFFEEDVKEGVPDWIQEELYKHGYEIYGYISINSQCGHKSRQRDEKTGKVERVPLKGRKSTKDKDGRLIPITDKETMEILEARYDLSFEAHERRDHVTKRACDYFIFPERMNTIRRTYSALKEKAFHCLRHSACTNLAGKTRNQILTRFILGHKSISAYDRYLHIYESTIKNSRKQKRNHRRRNLKIA